VTDVTGAPVDVLHTLFHSDQGGHEQVVLCQDRASGLKAVIAIHSTALGPALGGTRFYPYATEEEAVADALNLSRGMSYKNAMAGLDHGGGKAVIIGDPEQIKTEELLLAYGRFVASLGGRYVTACDVGTYVADMDVVARECRWTTGRSPENGGAGDSSVLTAFGVFQGMRASAQHLWGDPRCAAAGSASRVWARSGTTSWSICWRTAPRS
jgi:valine dehydrogenase (NAD+)